MCLVGALPASVSSVGAVVLSIPSRIYRPLSMFSEVSFPVV